MVAEVIPGASSESVKWGDQIAGATGVGLFDKMDDLASETDKVARRVQDDETLARRGVQAVDDPHFAVRGAAYGALARAEAVELPRLCQALVDDPDPYVRRVIARELPRFADPRAEQALRAYRGRCLEARDGRGVETADEALKQIQARPRK